MRATLNVNNFSYYAFHSKSFELSKKDQKMAFALSVLLGMTTFGFGHLICLIVYNIKKQLIDSERLRHINNLAKSSLNNDKTIPPQPSQQKHHELPHNPQKEEPSSSKKQEPVQPISSSSITPVPPPIRDILDNVVPYYGNVLSLKAKAALEKINAVFAKELPSFSHMFEKHALHDAVTVVTDELKHRPDLQKEWKVFLNSKPTCLFPDGRSTTLDFSLEVQRLENSLPALKAKCFSKEDAGIYITFPENQIKGIREVLYDSFPIDELRGGNVANTRGINTKCNDALCINIYNKQSREVYGVLFADRLRLATSKQPVLYISAVSRLAKASRLGVGVKLFEKFFETVKADKNLKNYEIILHVNKNNAAACALYNKVGMTVCEDTDRYAISGVQVESDELLFVYHQNNG